AGSSSRPRPYRLPGVRLGPTPGTGHSFFSRCEAQVAIAAGGIWLLAFMFGAIRFDAIAMIGAISVVIGGTVVLGSNTSTSKQATAAIKAAEARRAELIGKIDLRLIGEAEG